MKKSKLNSIISACIVTDSIFSKLVRNMSKFFTERDIALFIKSEITKRRLKPSFEPIVGSVPGGAEPHHKPLNSPLKRGFCVIDLGVRVNSYCSDMTRTVFFGRPSIKEKKLYKSVLLAQKKAQKKLKNGAKGVDLWKISYNSLGSNKKKFIHGLGHGLGKHIHKKPFLKKKSKDFVKTGDIVTIEPGIYFKKRFGIRIEDDFLVTKTGSKKLTKAPNKLLIFS